ncbi:MAG TPA: AMP-binding protein [Candidatus Dormibacteraeota bacterium]
MPPAWAVHLRPGSEIPAEPEAARRWLRRGSLPGSLLHAGAGAALRCGSVELDHQALAAAVEEVAAGLGGLGVGPGDRVLLHAAASCEWVLACLGALRAGAVVVPVNPDYGDAEMAHILGDAEPAVMVADAGRLAGAARLRRAHPSVRRVLEVEDLPRPATPAPAAGLGPESPAVVIYTSGTTGRPKGALLDHGNLLAQGRGVVEAWRWERSDHLALALPLHHLHGLAMGLVGTLLAGASATLLRFSPEAVVAELRGGASLFFGVPAMYQRLAEHLEADPTDLSGVRLFVCGSAPLPPALFERCAALLGQPPLERYGITEGGVVVSTPYAGPRLPGRVGHPLPGVDVRLGDEAEVLLRGGQVFGGYWRNPAATAEVLEGGWLRTGDAGEIGEDGSLAIRGRLKEMIITGGLNVYPREVEAVLEEHPAVAEVAVAGLPSERWGEQVTAFVVARAPVTEADLVAHARARLAPYKCPRSVRFVAALPRNPLGKVRRAELVEGARER